MIEYPTKILLATDGTEHSTMAAEAAVALSNKTGAELHVVHVGQAQHSGTSGVTVEAGGLPGDSYEATVDRARKLLERQVEQVREAGGTIAETHLRIGSPPYEVVGRGKPRAVRRAVSGTIRRPVLGAAADYIVRSAHGPVLVVRGDGLLHGVPGAHAQDTVSEGEAEIVGERREDESL